MLARTLRRARRLSATLLGAAGLPRPPARPPVVDENWNYFQERMRWFVRRGLARSGVPGLSIALVDDRQLLWAEGFGWADREQRCRATPETVYQAGSITKVVNALAVMQLLDEQRIALDAPLTDYLPEFSMHTRWPQAAPITLRALLCHHAGLPTYYLKGFFSSDSLEQLQTTLRDEHLAYEPHTVFNYSNLGSDLLGLVLERVRGRTYAEAVHQWLLAPLGMSSTGFSPGAMLARGYVHDRPAAPTPIRDIPAGGLYSSVLDLARFMRMVLNGGQLEGVRVLNPAALTETLTPQYADCALDFGQRFGLGWMLSGLPIDGSGRQAWHNGSTRAFLSQLVLLPDRQLGVVVLANADRAGTLVHETAEEALRLAIEIRHGVTPAPKRLEPEITLPREQLAQHIGDYSLMGSLARISLGRRRLRLHVLHHKLDLVPVSTTRFRVEFNLLGLKSVPIPFPPIEFTAVADRRFAVLHDRVLVPAEKIPPYTITPGWRQHTGHYRLLNPDEEFLVDLEHCRRFIRDGRLLMNLRISGIENREVEIVVVPLNDEEAYVFGLGRNVGDVARLRVEDGRPRTYFSGYVFELERP